MAMSDVINRASKPVVGEVYEVSGIELREIEDKFNGGTRNALILHTDKGAIYASSAMAKEASEDFADAEKTLVGSTLRAVEYYNARLNRNLITFTII